MLLVKTSNLHVNSLNAKTNTCISIFINLRYLRLKLLKNKENNKKICHIFHHNFNNIPCYVMSEVWLERIYFALINDGLTLKTLKLAFIAFLIQTLHIYQQTKWKVNWVFFFLIRMDTRWNLTQISQINMTLYMSTDQHIIACDDILTTNKRAIYIYLLTSRH